MFCAVFFVIFRGFFIRILRILFYFLSWLCHSFFSGLFFALKRAIIFFLCECFLCVFLDFLSLVSSVCWVVFYPSLTDKYLIYSCLWHSFFRGFFSFLRSRKRGLFLWRKIRQIFFNGFAIIGAFIPNFRDKFLTFNGQFLQKNKFSVPPMAD